MKTIGVFGAGFSGMVTAYFLAKYGAKVKVFESSPRVGGLLKSKREPWGLVESAANGFLASPQFLKLCKDLEVEVIHATRTQRRRYIYRGRPRQLPLGGLELTRFLVGLFKKGPPPHGAPAGAWCETRYGYGATKYLIEPAVQGVFGAPLDQLSARLVYDYFFAKRPRPATGFRRGLCAPKAGMQELIDRLETKLDELGVSIERNVEIDLEASQEVVIATPAYAAAAILENRDQWFAQQLRRISYVPLSSVTLGFKSTARAFRGFGCLFPRAEDFRSLGVLFNTCIFEDRGPYETETYILPFATGETESTAMALKDRQRAFRLSESADVDSVTVYEKALPLYDLELEKILSSLHLPKKTHLVGNYLGQIGLTRMVDQCETVARKVTQKVSG